jgi:hypothetical protein
MWWVLLFLYALVAFPMSASGAYGMGVDLLLSLGFIGLVLTALRFN